MANYATIADLDSLGLLSRAFAAISDDDKTAALADGSRRVDAFMRSQWKLPLVAWDTMVTGWVVDLACYRLMSHRGYNPSTGADPIIRLKYEDVMADLKLANAGKLTPGVTDSYSGSTEGVTQAAGPTVYTADLRGFSQTGAYPQGAFVDDINQSE